MRTEKETAIIKRIVNHANAIRRRADDMEAAVAELEQHTRNRIAAHTLHSRKHSLPLGAGKAHATRAKRGKAILPQRAQREATVKMMGLLGKAAKKKAVALGAERLNREGAKGSKGGKA